MGDLLAGGKISEEYYATIQQYYSRLKGDERPRGNSKNLDLNLNKFKFSETAKILRKIGIFISVVKRCSARAMASPNMGHSMALA